MTNNTQAITLLVALLCFGPTRPAAAQVPPNSSATVEVPLVSTGVEPKKLDDPKDAERRESASDELTYKSDSSEPGVYRTLHYRLDPIKKVEIDSPMPVERIDTSPFVWITSTAPGQAWRIAWESAAACNSSIRVGTGSTWDLGPSTNLRIFEAKATSLEP